MNSKFFITLFLAAVFVFGLSSPALAQAVDEPLADAVQEAEAREIMAGIRCLVCQNQSIEDSDADLAKDLRLIVREQVAAGKSQQEVHEFLLERYGDWVLLAPPLRLRTILLWFGPLAFLILGSFALFVGVRGKTKENEADGGKAKKSKPSAPKTHFKITRLHFVSMLLGFGVLSALMYINFGQPNLAKTSVVEVGETGVNSDAELKTLFFDLKDYVERQPEDIEGLRRYAELSSRLGYLAEAANAYGRLYALNPELGVPILVLQGETTVRLAQGMVTPAARLVFLKIISIEQDHPAARYYLGLWFLQKENVTRALEIWELLKTESQYDAPWLPMLEFQIKLVKADMEQASGGMQQPTSQDIAEVANMSAEEQQQFILSMVERLRTRLENNPNDYESWWRLGKVEAQLGNIEAALAALEQAEIYAPAIKKAEISAEYLLLEQRLNQ